VVLMRAFLGGHLDGAVAEQNTPWPLTLAFTRAALFFEKRGITLVFRLVSLSGWPSADIHILATHHHQGMLGLGGTDTWNTINSSKYETIEVSSWNSKWKLYWGSWLAVRTKWDFTVHYRT
jgi:hypothetical protein